MKRRHSVLSIGMLVGASIITMHAFAIGTEYNGTVHERVLRYRDGSTVVYQADNIGGYSVAEEDILLGVAPDPDSIIQNRGSGIFIATSRWHDGIVPFQFASNLTDATTRARSLQAIEHWNSNSSIRLVERTSNNKDSFEDYLEFTKSSGCASYVGRLGGRQEIWVSDTCSSGSMVHEIGHALGLLHEHTRNDRDQYIMVNYDNIAEGRVHNFAIPTANDKDYGEYDYASIMHYGAYFFSTNGSPTISPYNDITGINMGQRNALSQGDLDAIDSIYSTDLALKVVAPDSVGVQQAFYIELEITNQGEQGANEVMIVAPIKNSNNLISYDGEGWECEQQANEVICGRAGLIEYSQTSLTLHFESSNEPPNFIKVNLSSRTADYNISNNGDELEETVAQAAHDELFEEPLQIGNAGDGRAISSTQSDDESGGAGVLHLFNFFLLGLLVLFRKAR